MTERSKVAVLSEGAYRSEGRDLVLRFGEFLETWKVFGATMWETSITHKGNSFVAQNKVFYGLVVVFFRPLVTIPMDILSHPVKPMGVICALLLFLPISYLYNRA